MIHVLLIDDEPDITFTITNILEYNRFKVNSFNDPISALNQYKVNFYDLVILDIKMPKMNGFQLCNKLREKDPKVKICFLTASELFYEKFRKIQFKLEKTIGEYYFIQKPIKNQDLLKRITTIINKDKVNNYIINDFIK
jgi:DNA-binding response OmpR family regulator